MADLVVLTHLLTYLLVMSDDVVSYSVTSSVVLGASASHVHRWWACPCSGSVILLVTATLLTRRGQVSMEMPSSRAVSMKVGHVLCQ